MVTAQTHLPPPPHWPHIKLIGTSSPPPFTKHPRGYAASGGQEPHLARAAGSSLGQGQEVVDFMPSSAKQSHVQQN